MKSDETSKSYQTECTVQPILKSHLRKYKMAGACADTDMLTSLRLCGSAVLLRCGNTCRLGSRQDEKTEELLDNPKPPVHLNLQLDSLGALVPQGSLLLRRHIKHDIGPPYLSL